MAAREGPVSRWHLVGGAMAVLLLFGVTATLVETLRHPFPDPVPDAPPTDPLADDPRVPTACPDPDPGTRPQRVTSGDLADCPAFWDGREVLYRGEAVGALLRRGAVVWAQLNDDVYAEALGPLPAHRDHRGGNAGIGVALPVAEAAGIRKVGGPGVQGDVVEIRGVFHRVDPESAEVAVIRADSAEVLRRGGSVPVEPLTDRRVAAYVIAALALGLTVAERIVARRR